MPEETIETLTFVGKWFFPDNPDEKFSARLHFNAVEGASLEQTDNSFAHIMMERFGEKDASKGTVTFDVTTEPISVPVILGYRNSEQVTLYGCAIFGFGSITAKTIIVGTHPNEQNNIDLVKLRIRYSGIDDWGASGGFSLTLPVDPTSAPIHAEYTPSPDIIVGIPTGELRISRFPAFTQYVTGAGLDLAERTWIEFSNAEPLSLEDCFGKCIWAFRDFLMLATNQIVTPTELIGFLSDSETEGKVEIYYADKGRRANLEIEKKPFEDPVFFLKQIDSEFGRAINAWFAKLDLIRPLSSLYLGLMYVPKNYTETEFLSLAQALEAFHRKRFGGEFMSDEQYIGIYEAIAGAIPEELNDDFKQRLSDTLKYANEFSLRKRLKELLVQLTNFYGGLVEQFIGRRNDFVDRVTKMRNELTHETKLSGSLDDPRLLNFTVDQLKCLTLFCLFAEFELSPETVSNITQNNRLFHNTRIAAK